MTEIAGDRLDVDIDYTAVFDVLSPAESERRVAMWSPARVNHAYAVRRRAADYAAVEFDGLPWRARKYWTAVVETSALLHEAMVGGTRFEDVEAVSDFRTARAVSAMTPDFREPPEWRRRSVANRIGLSPLHVQMVALADVVEDRPADAEYLRCLLECLHLVRKAAATRPA